MRTLLIALALLFAGCPAAWALSYSTHESGFVNISTLYFTLYAQEHNGQNPGSWAELQPYFPRPWDEAYPTVVPTKRYAFLATPLRLSESNEGWEIVVITRRPFRDVRLVQGPFGGIIHDVTELRRYVIMRSTTSEEFQSRSFPEERVLQLFAGAEALLPTPDTEPLRKHESEALQEAWLRKIAFGATAAGIIMLILRHRFRRTPGPLRWERTWSKPEDV